MSSPLDPQPIAEAELLEVCARNIAEILPTLAGDRSPLPAEVNAMIEQRQYDEVVALFYQRLQHFYILTNVWLSLAKEEDPLLAEHHRQNANRAALAACVCLAKNVEAFQKYKSTLDIPLTRSFYAIHCFNSLIMIRLFASELHAHGPEKNQLVDQLSIYAPAITAALADRAALIQAYPTVLEQADTLRADILRADTLAALLAPT